MEVLTWQARNKRGLTLKQLEAATGIGKTTLNNIENGLVSPTLNQLEEVAHPQRHTEVSAIVRVAPSSPVDA